MPGEYLKGFPDPPNSPNEKFLLPSTPHLWQDDLYRDLINNGAPHDLALAISRSIAQHEDRKALVEQHQRRELEWWANVHTHPGGTGEGGTLSLFEVPPYRLASHDNNERTSDNHGDTWETGVSATNLSTRRMFAFDDKIFAPSQIRWNLYVYHDDKSRDSVTLQSTATNGNRVYCGAYSKPLHTLVVAGGNSGSTHIFTAPAGGDIYSNGGGDGSGNDWTLTTLSHGTMSDVAVTASGSFVAVTRSGRFLWSDDGYDWNFIPDLPTFCSIQEHKGILVALEHESPGGIYTSTDGGTSWVERIQGGSVESNTYTHQPVCTSNGQVILAGRYNGLYQSEDGMSWSVVPGTGEDHFGQVAWDGTTWLAATRWETTSPKSNPQIWQTYDPLGLADWSVVWDSPGDWCNVLL